MSDRSRLSLEAILPSKNGAGRGNRPGVRSSDPRRMQGHVHRRGETRVSLSAET